MRRLTILVCLLLLSGCKREQRDLRMDPPIDSAMNAIALMPELISGAPPDVEVALGKRYDGNAWQLSQGKRLYDWFNCKGCHANGGGASGPAFLDGWWRYGPDIVSVFSSIRDGRPHGMPAFRDKLTTEQMWQLSGYVRSMGMYKPVTAAPGRNDEMQSRPAEGRGPAASDPYYPSR
jgi:cytochrome c oxidase cbb3-type subunit 3